MMLKTAAHRHVIIRNVDPSRTDQSLRTVDSRVTLHVMRLIHIRYLPRVSCTTLRRGQNPCAGWNESFDVTLRCNPTRLPVHLPYTRSYSSIVRPSQTLGQLMAAKPLVKILAIITGSVLTNNWLSTYTEYLDIAMLQD